METIRNSKGQFVKGVKPPNYKGRIKRTGYWYLYMPTHPYAGKQGYIAEHRIVMEKKLGRFLNPQEAVHHIDHDITNNDITNLELYATHGQHTKIAHPEVHYEQKLKFKGKHFSPKTEFKKGQKAWNKGMRHVSPGKWV